MTLPTTGSLSFSQIRNEFGPAQTLGSYRISFSNIAQGGTLDNIPLDDGIPQGNSQISFNDFRGKSVNIVVDFYTGGPETRPVARDAYVAGRRIAVGGFKTLNEDTGGSKVIIDIGKEIRSNNFSNQSEPREFCAFRTGVWSNGTASVEIRVGPNGYIQGHGGDGGDGGNNGSSDGQNGADGGGAIGLQQPDVIIGPIQGLVFGGSGGGGGASGRRGNGRNAGGGGGGGGAGLPAGIGGDGGNPPNGGSAAEDGQDGTLTTGGDGGAGGDLSGQDGGDGGDGGSRPANLGDGQDGGNASGGEAGDGDGGQGGEAFRVGGQINVVTNDPNILALLEYGQTVL